MSPPKARLTARRAHVSHPGEQAAISALCAALEGDGASAVLLYCSGGYDLEQLGPAIARAFTGPVLACTATGQIGPEGFQGQGITGISLRGADLELRPYLLSPLPSCREQAFDLAERHAERLRRRPELRSFGVLLVDGTSSWEELLAAALYESLGNVPVVGGSAAAPAPGQPAAVYHDGRFHRGAAVVGLFETTGVDFDTFATHHFVPSARKLVITLADPERRVVYEIDGQPAARAYARALGVEPGELSRARFARTPLLLDLGEHLLPRAILARGADDSLLLACAIEEGLVVSLADGTDPLGTLSSCLERVGRRAPRPSALLVFDSELTHLELAERGESEQVGALLAAHGAVGFYGNGAQLGPLHTNQTLTGIALRDAAGVAK